jgi:integrase
MGVYRRGKHYNYSFEFAGERVRCSTRQGNKEAAKTMMAAHRTRLAQGLQGIEEIKPAPLFKDFAWGRYWTQMLADHGSKPKTLNYKRTSLRMLSRYAPLQNLRLDRINADAIDALVVWLRKQKAQNKPTRLTIASMNRTLEVLRHLMNCADRWGLIRKAPEVEKLDGEAGRDFVLAPDQEVSYLAATAAESDELHAVAVAMLDAGWRPEECFRFQWEHVRFAASGDARFGAVFCPHGKTRNARRSVPMTQRLNAVLEMRHAAQGEPKAGWVFPRPDRKCGHVECLLDEHNAAVTKAGLPHFVLYGLRHTALTRLAQSGCDAFTLMKLAGHASVATSQKYVHVGEEHAQAAFTKFEAYNLQQAKKAEADAKKEQVQ